jgi:hypothetical protein
MGINAPFPDSRPALTPQPLSAVLIDIAGRDQHDITLGELMRAFGGRAIGAVLFVFGLICTLPLPPGATSVFGLPLLLLAPQLIIGASAPWLPSGIKAHPLSLDDVRGPLMQVLPWLRRIEAVSKPRMSFLFGAVGERLIGLICTLLAVVLILPIPFGNMLPGLTVTVLSFSLIQRDGFIGLLGLALAAASATVLVAAAHIVVSLVSSALGWISAP